MKGSPRSLWLSAANRAAGWWMGTAANLARRQQRAVLADMAKAAAGPKAKRKRPAKRRTG
ncbi:hypothetical protein OPKNFCMD_0776 [Methylobacterium crusticola]|uniref:Uncharacterized protein n=1 Tax=Methylobacterium crusticola TaxID=1697972 RepID=A0ABQ4QRW5_9HYPH|nr:hypothetical protein [Methylobacterium crusticola]GJD48060.1 hypothetical protein OPKNFCMD_0776 [Methylobacterium crusticola]